MTFLIPVAALAVSFGFTYLWYKTSPASGSGWAMFAAVIFALCGSYDMGATAKVLTALIAAGGFGFIWYKTKDMEYSGWLLAIAILRALSAF